MTPGNQSDNQRESLSDEVGQLKRRLSDAEDELSFLRRHAGDGAEGFKALEERLLETRAQLAQANSRNEKLIFALQQAKEHVESLREEVAKLAQPPCGYGTFIQANDDGTVDVLTGGRKMRVAVHPDVDITALSKGQEVLLNESYAVLLAKEPESSGEVVTLKEVMDGKKRAIVYARADEERVVELASDLEGVKLRSGDTLLMEPKGMLVVERLPRPEVEELVLEEVPNVTYNDVGGLDSQIEAIMDAVELPYLYRKLFNDYKLPAPKGILLYGPPGCGKTLIAKAVANSLAHKVAEVTGNSEARSYFLNIKGPELLNKYVGETERQLRLVFERAREKADEGVPVIVFFDEMDSLFRTRGTGISSDVESTIVPQLLAEIDGVEALKDVIVIGASNREDLIDPAILRPGRLDVKIKIERPDEVAAAQIFSRYLTADLPIDSKEVELAGGGDPSKAVNAMIDAAVSQMYASGEDNRFLEVTYQNGDKEVLYFKDFASGAMIENVVRRAKKAAIKRQIANESVGIKSEDLIASIHQEYKENEDLPNTTNPDDWAKISGKKGERIVYVRTLVSDHNETKGGRSIEKVGTGQYL
ncbi:MAG: proteasome ATPase [Actinobacteria bacterium]|nr:proteasome ATPase [Actinomycetota bacterium]MCL5446995.1 proteasome ATPase [Actinomycetota bacterium]